MNIEIREDQVKFIQNLIDNGDYQNETEVIVAALKLLKKRQDTMQYLRNEIDPALKSLERGEGVVMNEDELDTFFEDIVRRGTERHRQSTPK